VSTRADVYELYIDLLREDIDTYLDRSTVSRYGEVFHRLIEKYHRMWITHTNRSEVKSPPFDSDISYSCLHWDELITDDRGSHIDGDILAVGSQYDDTPCCFYADFVFFCESLLSDILEKTPSTIATHLYF
jgi:hypothetical protein